MQDRTHDRLRGDKRTDESLAFKVMIEYLHATFFNIKWVRPKEKRGRVAKKRVNYRYDPLNRITSAIDNTNNYNVSNIGYDKNGNIQSLTRNGWQDSSNFTDMDVLDYDYDSGNKLLKVADTGNDNYGFIDRADQSVEFTYDINGNLLTDLNKGITAIAYNHLDMPTNITVSNPQHNGSISYVYSANGIKLQKIVNEGVNTTTTDYAGNYVYENGNLKQITQPEGYIEPDGSGGYDYVYRYADIWGNTRITYADDNNDGNIDPATEIRREQNYYPFGLKHKGYNSGTSPLGNSVANRWKFGGKEYQEELDLAWYDVTARNYDPALGRWMNLDPLAEQMRRHSPYNYAFDNPVFFTDPDGMMPCPTGDCPPETRSGNPNDHRPKPVGDTSSASSGSTSSSKVSGTDIVRSVSAEAAYTGVQSSRVRAQYDKRVSQLNVNNSKGRRQIKMETRAKTPAVTRAVIESKRPSSAEMKKTSGTASKSNAKVNNTAKNLGRAGGIFVVAGVAASANNIANSENKAEAVATEAGAWTGAIVGGEVLGTAGSTLGPYGALGGALIGSIIGGVAGEDAVNDLLNAESKGIENQTRNGYGKEPFESKKRRE